MNCAKNHGEKLNGKKKNTIIFLRRQLKIFYRSLNLIVTIKRHFNDAKSLLYLMKKKQKMM